MEAIRFVAESGQRPARLDSGLGSGIAGADAQKLRIITSLLVAQRASVLVEVLDTLARRACEIRQSKKTSVIGRSSHCTVRPEIMKSRIVMNASPSGKHRSGARRLRGRVRLAAGLRPAHTGRLPRGRGAEPNLVAPGRRRCHAAHQTGRGHSRRRTTRQVKVPGQRIREPARSPTSRGGSRIS